MKQRKLSPRTASVVLLATIALVFAPAAPAQAQERPIDAQRSTITVRVGKSGLFSAFGHDHTVRAAIRSGHVNLGRLSVELAIASRELQVLDPQEKPDKRAEIQQRMLGPEVLDVERHPEIRFRSTRVQKRSADEWQVEGELLLHGQTHPVVLRVTGRDGIYRGRATVRQRDFGITPVSVAGGSVKVKNEVVVEFEVVLAPAL